jgi:ribonuclease HII
MIEHPLEKDLEFDRILGIDEAGRGPMAGPLVVAGVIFPKGYSHDEINDSKKQTEKKREQLFDQIMQDALWYEIIFVSESTIDHLNIYAATQQAMFKIAEDAKADYVLTDAMKLPYYKGRYEAIIKGDSKSLSIAAGSILAKVSRDRYMKILDEKYPEYKFGKHKGYPTKEHIEALHKYGILDCLRKSYRPVAEMLEIRLF